MERHQFEIEGRGYRDTAEVPKGEDIFYRCDVCDDHFSSAPYANAGCHCGNVFIDWAAFRLFVRDFETFTVLRKTS
jgi:hypothetical protein